MKLFIKRLILFLTLPLLVVLSLDIYLRNINTSSAAKYDGLMEVKKDIEVVFLGNSHANFSINPTYFTSFPTYNLADVSQQIYFDKRILTKAMNDGVSNLKYVFISVDYHSLYTSSQGIRDVWTYYANGIKYKNRNYTKERISPFLWGYTPKISISLIKKEISRKIKYGDSVIDFDVLPGVIITDTLTHGFIGRSGQLKKAFNKNIYKERAAYFSETDMGSERKEVIEDLKSFISFLKENNIQPILFSSPTYKDYNAFLDKGTIIKNKNDIAIICNEFNLQYWRYNEDIRFSDKDFYDQDHLNKRGAAKFSTILNSRLLEYDMELTHNR